ncbi:hypothetical protein GUJ93_ZPchr0006g45739 [Zizania palustris]|uniref:Uncharacterized protein n=1 Tax=Zizania palustris TaxID=103762 RepID=A0A8J5VHL6_ZIZPA|nr:hypothetical protein GUJ93_ZPchr0006g45739 [Zizania palustris]
MLTLKVNACVSVITLRHDRKFWILNRLLPSFVALYNHPDRERESFRAILIQRERERERAACFDLILIVGSSWPDQLNRGSNFPEKRSNQQAKSEKRGEL